MLSPMDGDDRVRLDPEVVDRAAEWLVLLQADDSDAQRAACLAWRNASPEHEQAWLRLAVLMKDLRTTAAYSTPRLAARTLDTVAARQSRRMALKWALGVGGAGAVAWTAIDVTPWRTWSADYRTAPGEQRAIMLNDGTHVVLNAGSAIDVRFGDTVREIILRAGEVQVTSGKDARQRPLSLSTSLGSIRPIGTRFIVRDRQASSHDILVAVIEGAVEVRPRLQSAPPTLVHAGQQATFDAGRVVSAGAAPALADAWVNGMLIASRMRLDAFLGELSRYRRGVVRCDPAIAGQLVTGAFPVADTDRVLAMLESVLPVRVVYRTRYWVSVSAR